jgi:hypothetical protein
MSINIHEIARRTEIVELHCRKWTPSARHKAETHEVNARHGTSDDTASVSVRYCSHPALKEIETIFGKLRADHAGMTHPSCTDGLRTIKIGRKFDHYELIRTARESVEAPLARFLADYDTERLAAPARLNGLYIARQWPDIAVIRGKFAVECRYLECRTDGAWGDWLTDSARTADEAALVAVKKAVKRIVETCGNLDGRLYSTVFTSLRDLLRDMPDLDLSDSEELVKLSAAVQPLSQYDSESVKKDRKTRIDVSAQAANILAMFDGASL